MTAQASTSSLHDGSDPANAAGGPAKTEERVGIEVRQMLPSVNIGNSKNIDENYTAFHISILDPRPFGYNHEKATLEMGGIEEICGDGHLSRRGGGASGLTEEKNYIEMSS